MPTPVFRRIDERGTRHAIDPLEAHLLERRLPDLLVVREHVPVRQAVAERVVQPLVEVRGLRLVGILDERLEDVDDLLFGENVDAVLEWIFDVQSLVENLVGANALVHVVAEHRDLVGEGLLVLRKQDVTADIRAEPVRAEAARKAAGSGVGLEDLDVTAEEIGGEEPRHSATQYAHVTHATPPDSGQALADRAAGVAGPAGRCPPWTRSAASRRDARTAGRAAGACAWRTRASSRARSSRRACCTASR